MKFIAFLTLASGWVASGVLFYLAYLNRSHWYALVQVLLSVVCLLWSVMKTRVVWHKGFRI